MAKYRMKEEVAEVYSARSKLDGVLQTLVEQKDDGMCSSPEKDLYSRVESEVEIEDYSPLGVVLKSPRSVSSRGGKVGRKRKFGKDEPASTLEYGQYHHSYVMKLFDRSVDLAQFDEDTPLYPVCRAWIRNDPHGSTSSTDPLAANLLSTGDNEDDDKDLTATAGFVYDLPRPITVKQEYGSEHVDLRIPSPLPSTDEPYDVNADESTWPDSETLLVNHMHRWKLIRQRWKAAAVENEYQYSESLDIIKELYDRHNS